MSFRGSSACPALEDKADRQWIGTKEELINEYTIRGSILRKDIWKRKDSSEYPGEKEEACQKKGQGRIDYNSPASSSNEDGGFREEETVISKELALTSDYGRDLLSYRLFYISPSEGGAAREPDMVTAREDLRLAQCREPSEPACEVREETGYGIEISHRRKCAGGFWELKDYQRVEAISQDMNQCSLFFSSLVEGKVFPCSLKDLLEDYGEIF